MKRHVHILILLSLCLTACKKHPFTIEGKWAVIKDSLGTVTTRPHDAYIIFTHGFGYYTTEIHEPHRYLTMVNQQFTYKIVHDTILNNHYERIKNWTETCTFHLSKADKKMYLNCTSHYGNSHYELQKVSDSTELYNALYDGYTPTRKEIVAADSIWINHMTKLHEPDISKSGKETYRYLWVRPFKTDYIFTVQRQFDNSIILTSQSINESFDPHAIAKDTILSTTEQRLNSEEWNHFKELLDGSYYWAFRNPCPQGDGIMDGNEVILESNSWTCNSFDLQYHRVVIHVPKEGSFRRAFYYLVRQSNLVKKDTTTLNEIRDQEK